MNPTLGQNILKINGTHMEPETTAYSAGNDFTRTTKALQADPDWTGTDAGDVQLADEAGFFCLSVISLWGLDARLDLLLVPD